MQVRAMRASFIRLLMFAVSILLVGVLIEGCDEQQLSTYPEVEAPVFEIVDAAHLGGNQDFFFLPPLVPNPSGVATYDEDAFDVGQLPTVEICELEGTEGPCAGDPLEIFTMFGEPGSETIRVDELEQHYIVNWHTDEYSLIPDKYYRITVLIDGTELGHADVDVVSSGKELKNVETGQYIAMKDGRTLPIKFRIQYGARRWVGAGGGTTVGEEGNWTLEVPPGALDATVQINATGSVDSPSPENLLPGTAWDFGPEGLEFASPATLTITYNPDDLSPGKYPRLHKLVGDEWQPVDGSVADLETGRVSGPVDEFSNWGVLEGQLALTIYIDGYGVVTVEGGDPSGGCGMDIIAPCELGVDFEDPPLEVTLVAEAGGPDFHFEGWTGTGAGLDCPESACTIVMTEDRDVTAHFSAPGLVAIDPNEVSFTVPYKGTEPPMIETVELSNIGGRTSHVLPIEIYYDQAGQEWLDAQIDNLAIEPGATEILTLTVNTSIATDLFPGGYGATVVALAGGGHTGGVIEVTLTVDASGVQYEYNDGGPGLGAWPIVVFNLTDPLGENLYYDGVISDFPSPLPYRFGFFDTGSKIVFISGLDASAQFMDIGAASHSNTKQNARVRLNGFGAIDPTTLGAPMGPEGEVGGAQIEALDLRVGPPGTNRADQGVSLIGAPVANQVVALIDNTRILYRGDYPPSLCGGDPCQASAPDMTFYRPGGASTPVPHLVLALERFGATDPSSVDGATQGHWYYIRNVEFENNGVVVNDVQTVPEPYNFFYDTGSNITPINGRLADTLGVNLAVPSPDCYPLDPNLDGYMIDRITIYGSAALNGGSYTVTNVCVAVLNLPSYEDAIIGSNLFMYRPVLFDGVHNYVGIVGNP